MVNDKIASCRVERRGFLASFDFFKSFAIKKGRTLGKRATFLNTTNEKSYRLLSTAADNSGVKPDRQQHR